MSRSWSIALQANPDRNPGTLAGSATYLDLSAHSLDPLAHRGESYARLGGRGIEPSAVVDYSGQDLFALHPQLHHDFPCSGVATDVCEGLL